MGLETPTELRRQFSSQVVLFNGKAIVILLIMVAGHSYVFTGWEVGYPLLARNDDFGAWTSAMIGITFLVGSVGLLVHTLFTYPAMAKSMGLNAVWTWSWIVCIS